MAIETDPLLEPLAPTPDEEPAVSSRLRSLQLAEKERRVHGGGWRKLLWLALAAVIGVSAYVGSQVWPQQTGEKAREVAAVRVEDPSAAALLDLTGYIVPRSKIDISPQIGGRIVELPVVEGMRVKQGDLLARVEDTSFRADLAQARAAHESAKNKLAELKNGARAEEISQAEALLEATRARLALSKSNHQRATKIRQTESTLISQSDFDRLVAELADSEAQVNNRVKSLELLKIGPRAEQIAAAEAEVERAAAMIDKAEFWVENASIHSPIDGTVLERKAEPGESVHPELVMTSLLTIADLGQLEVEVDVQEQDVKQVRVGSPCVITPDAYPDSHYEGRVDRLMPVVSRARGVVQTRVTVLNPDEHLLVEMNCQVKFLPSAEQAALNVMKLPIAAVLDEPTGPVVFVLEGEVARRRPVQLGPEENGQRPLQGGLTPGELVLLPGEQPLVEGERVRVKSDRAASGS